MDPYLPLRRTIRHASAVRSTAACLPTDPQLGTSAKPWDAPRQALAALPAPGVTAVVEQLAARAERAVFDRLSDADQRR